MKKVKRINESQLRAIVAESVKKVLNESQYGVSYDDQLTVGELIEKLQKFNPSSRVEVYVGDNTFNCISDVHADFPGLFMKKSDYDSYLKREKEYIDNDYDDRDMYEDDPDRGHTYGY